MPPTTSEYLLTRRSLPQTYAWIKALDACRRDTQQCYYSDACGNKPDQAHVLSEGWLKTLTPGDAKGKVYWFARGKGLPRSIHDGIRDGLAAPALVRRWREAYPEAVAVGTAAAAKFCCHDHDQVFRDIDSLDSLDLQCPSARHRHLMFLRPLLRQLHWQTTAALYRQRHPEMSAGLESRYPRMDEHNIDSLQEARRRVQEALGAKGGSWCVKHMVRHLPGEPRLAAALVSRWPGKGEGVAQANQLCTGPWGCTVIPYDRRPRARGHLVVFHYCTLLPKGPRARRDLQRKKTRLQDAMIGDGDCLLARRVSKLLLTQCEDLCLAPAAWAAYPERVREAVWDTVFVRSMGIAPSFCGNIDLFA